MSHNAERTPDVKIKKGHQKEDKVVHQPMNSIDDHRSLTFNKACEEGMCK